MVYLDFWRTCGWDARYEYVEPVINSYRKKYGCAPPTDHNDPSWKEHVFEYVISYIRRLRNHLNASGRKIELAVGLPIDPFDENATPDFGYDLNWRKLIDEGLIDTLIVSYVKWDKGNPIDSTRGLYKEIMRVVDGRCKVLFPVQQYNFSKFGLPSYQETTGKKHEEVAGELMEMAWEEGASGISMEVVDYNNYPSKTRQKLKSLSTTKCHNILQKPNR